MAPPSDILAKRSSLSRPSDITAPDKEGAYGPDGQQIDRTPSPKKSPTASNPDRGSPARTETHFYNEGKKPKGQATPPLNTLDDKQLSEVPNDLTSPKAIPSGDDPNYHTAAEDAGENYFPQILKYTENVP